MLSPDFEKTEKFPDYAKLIRGFLKKFPWSICYDPAADDQRKVISEMPLPEKKDESKD
ncbi:hypothetical protein HY085_03140 [Candidatus Gottesmanbacteria bacterium]|nr:hypothetical protein [Candidatus Gottesmanbacteria bacterium]